MGGLEAESDRFACCRRGNLGARPDEPRRRRQCRGDRRPHGNRCFVVFSPTNPLSPFGVTEKTSETTMRCRIHPGFPCLTVSLSAATKSSPLTSNGVGGRSVAPTIGRDVHTRTARQLRFDWHSVLIYSYYPSPTVAFDLNEGNSRCLPLSRAAPPRGGGLGRADYAGGSRFFRTEDSSGARRRVFRMPRRAETERRPAARFASGLAEWRRCGRGDRAR